MNHPKNLFTKQASLYRKFRPQYPQQLLEDIATLVPKKQTLWDVATGSGQVAHALAPHFEQVYAIDINPQQLTHAIPKNNIHYSQQAAEQTTFKAQQFDLITVAQALHWLDAPAFYKEVRRVGKKGGILAVWGYGLLQIEPAINTLIQHYYTQVIGPYWHPARQHIDNQYSSIPFPFEEVNMPNCYSIELFWTREELAGYLNTWSSLQHYLAQHTHNPVLDLMEKIKEYWPDKEPKKITFPIFLKVGQL